MGAIQSSSGVITEEGGLLSHASVVCRELGIPCGIAVVDATKIIVDGSHIRLDATNGKVFLNINNSL
jgi:pyruvate,water dikinase